MSPHITSWSLCFIVLRFGISRIDLPLDHIPIIYMCVNEYKNQCINRHTSYFRVGLEDRGWLQWSARTLGLPEDRPERRRGTQAGVHPGVAGT